MGVLQDSYYIFNREFMIYVSNLRTNLFRTALFPLVILVFFSFLGAAITNVPVAVVNYANNVQSQQLISALSAQRLMNVQAVTTQSQALDMLNSGTVNFVIVILPTFPSQSGTPTVEVYYNNLEYSTTEEVLPAIQNEVALFGPGSNFQSKEYLPSSTSDASSITTPVTGASGNYDDFLFSGVIGMIIVFSSLFVGGIGVILDRQGGQIKSFLITPINKSAIVIGKVLFGAVQSLFSVFVVVIIGLLLGNTILMGVVGIFWILVLGMLLAISMSSVSLIIASRMKNMAAFQIFAQTIGMPLWLISGGIFPISSLPSVLQALSVVEPMTYAINGFRFIILQGSFPLASLLTDLAILGAFAAVAAAVAIIMFKSTID